ncbi:hypothetical protein AAFF_G00339720 [Aldrovandia affinis]|uniref:Uncharacterized protein n=1 Tax=Aldrovandia affinis TaxID=143900 RepID=A0AAD7SKE2_9TELE|nr:hypothetical protein AAFF_G00339720 [Aldrovandia affinis]
MEPDSQDLCSSHLRGFVTKRTGETRRCESKSGYHTARLNRDSPRSAGIGRLLRPAGGLSKDGTGQIFVRRLEPGEMTQRLYSE